MNLYVIRHGQSTMNIGKGGGADCELSEIGYWQAQQIPTYFKDIKVKVIFSSPLRRALLSALPLARACNLPVILVPEMSEMFLDQWTEYRDYNWLRCDQIESDYDNVRFIHTHDKSKQWWPVWPEDQRAVRARVRSFYDRHIAPELGTDENIVVVGHGQSTADLKQIANPGDMIPVYNAGIVKFTMRADGKCESAEVFTEHLGIHVAD
ncbi:histidine phosphatase family protein [Paenibacillus apis]|uniref:Phosphoglycerate mutase n=1 Tax=Paenibacillus apis TaxID=1792174 RepID=A0A920CJJ4_9BACL|nr:histidine phosphatase family protein [Paenibacillus apis]GIO42836.1 phosphoglycerate mutase [Paenibacillus apis]